MASILIGLIFLLYDLNIVQGTSVIGLLPDFVGYYLIHSGLRHLVDDYRMTYRLPAQIARGMTWVSLAWYIALICGVTRSLVIGYMGAVVQLTVILVQTYTILRFLQHLEKADRCDLDAEGMFLYWKFLFAFLCVGWLHWVLRVLSAIVNLIFLIRFNTARRVVDTT